MIIPSNSGTFIDPIQRPSLSRTAVYEAVRNAAGIIINFQMTKPNDPAQVRSDDSEQADGNQLLSDLFPPNDVQFLILQFTLVVECSRSVRFEMSVPFNPAQPPRNCEITIDPIGADQVKVTCSYPSATEQQRQQADLFDRIIQTAPSALALHRTLFDDVGDIIDFQIIKANPLAFEWLGIKPEDASVKPLSDLIPGFQLSEVFQRYMRVAQTGESDRFEQNFGSRWFEFSVARFDQSIIVTANKITERKQAERALKVQTERTEGVLDAIPSGIFVSEAVRDSEGTIVDFRITQANAAALRTTQRERTTVVGQLASVVFPGDRYNGIFDHYITAIQTRQTQRFEYRFRRDDQTHWLDVQLAYIGRDQVLAAHNDVTPLKVAEAQRSEQAETFAGVLQSTRTGMNVMEFVRDSDGKLVDLVYQYVSDQVLRDTGLTREQMIGKRVLDLFPAVRKTRYWTAYQHVLDTGEAQEFEMHYNYEGYNNYLLCQVTLLDENRAISSYQIINDLKQAQIALEQQSESLERANRDLQLSNDNLQQFAYVASHDLQEPLRKIQAFGDLLIEKHALVLGEEGTDMLTRMQSASQRMSLLIRDLLAYSRVSTQRESHRLVSLNRLVGEVIDTLSVAVEESKAQVEVGTLPDLMGDPVQLGQLFQNLLGNALKFRRANVQPLIRVSSQSLPIEQAPAGLLPRLSGLKQVAEITITDNGIGFDAQHAERIFHVFQRLHGRNQYAGSGIGLAICRRVVENHGGGIVASSTQGEGATFQVYLPL